MKRLLAFLLFAGSLLAQTNSARMLSGVNAQTGTSYTFVAADSTRVTTFSNGSAVAVTLPAGTTLNFGVGAIFSAKNIGVGTATITCSSCTINATGTPASTLALPTGQNVDLYSDGTNYVAYVGSGTTGIAGTPVSPTAPNFGDALCFNLYGDNQWDICPLPRYIQVFADGSNPPIQLGHGNAPGTTANHTFVGETATESPAETFNTTAAASTNVSAAITQGFNGSNDAIFSLGTTFRLTTRVVFNSTTNVRYWWGLFRKNSNGNTAYATDAPNFPTAAFRYSAGTDTTVKAYVATDSTHFTVVDTGIALNTTASVIYDVVNTGTSIVFRINGANVATISTNYPGAATQIAPAVFCDNKNTANDVSFTFWYWTQLLK